MQLPYRDMWQVEIIVLDKLEIGIAVRSSRREVFTAKLLGVFDAIFL